MNYRVVILGYLVSLGNLVSLGDLVSFGYFVIWKLLVLDQQQCPFDRTPKWVLCLL